MTTQALRSPLTARHLLDRYRNGTLTPTACIADVLARIETFARPEVWIARVEPAVLHVRAAQLEALQRAAQEAGEDVFARLPLFGVPFAVKDNIDVAGMPTTAACPEFAYTPVESAFVVDALLAAGAILIGKTNLDQFATGLVGVRSPFGAVRHTEVEARVSGGSSSGSAVAVASGCVAFSLGTDTAGSGRVPAGFNGIVGLKPSLGLVSARGVVPACRTLDCVSIFAHDVSDAWRVLQQLAKFDARDSYARRVPTLGLTARTPRLGVPSQLEFFGDDNARDAFAAVLDATLAHFEASAQAVDMTPFAQTAQLLYDGPWVAERRAAVGAFFDTHRAAMDATVAAVIAQADRFSAVDAFDAQYRLAAFKRDAEALFERIDVLIVPTTPTHPTIDAVHADPIARNSQLGYYTNFVNLLDLCALAVPGPRRADGLPAGLTLIAPAGADHRLAVLGARIEALFKEADTDLADLAMQPLPYEEASVTLAVVGAHLRGQPLNVQLLEAGARFLEATTTAPDYRLYALDEAPPVRPALVRTPQAGAAIALELWQMPLRLFGPFVARVPAPLGIGTVQLADGRSVKGFICEPWAVAPETGAQDVTAFGGWLAYRASLAQ